MNYTPSLGIMGNLKALMRRETQTNNNFIEHKSNYDIDHIQMEQQATELDLMQISAEQSITDLDLRVMELEAK